MRSRPEPEVGVASPAPAEIPKWEALERIHQANWDRFSSPAGRANLRVIDLTFEERWIYLLELLQNAVDAGAKRIAIDADADQLIFQHDGSEPLTAQNVEGIAGLFSRPRAWEQSASWE